jgi:hypothetical protein
MKIQDIILWLGFIEARWGFSHAVTFFGEHQSTIYIMSGRHSS